MYVHICMYVCRHERSCLCGQKRVLSLLELELWVMVSCLSLVLGTGLWSPKRKAMALNC